MEEEKLTLDKEYLEAFNIGYSLSKETGLRAENLHKLKPEFLEKMGISKNRIDAIKQGMQQFIKEKERVQEKNKSNKVSKSRDFRAILDNIKKEQEEREKKVNRDKGISR